MRALLLILCLLVLTGLSTLARADTTPQSQATDGMSEPSSQVADGDAEQDPQPWRPSRTDGGDPGDWAPGGRGGAWRYLASMLGTVMLLGGSLFLLRKARQRFLPGMVGHRSLELLERLSLERNQAIALVRCRDRQLLVGLGPSGPRLLGSLPLPTPVAGGALADTETDTRQELGLAPFREEQP
jgi:flagellar biogenesis protein FliO